MKILKNKGIEIKYENCLINQTEDNINIEIDKEKKSLIDIISHKNYKINIISKEKSNLNLQLFYYSNINLEIKLGEKSNNQITHIGIGNANIKSNIKLNNETKLIHAHSNICKKDENSKTDIVNELTEKSKTHIISRNILDDNSSSDLSCMIKINKEGNEANGIQDLKTMLLNQNTKSKILPLLEIENKNVSCKHGAGTLSPNKNILFYLQSRGLKKEKALKMIKQSHISQITNYLNEENNKKIIELL